MISFAKARHHAYLRSPEWRAIRAEALERDGHRCQLCGGRRRLEGHHWRYPRGWEADSPANVTILCHWCHKGHHKRAARHLRFVHVMLALAAIAIALWGYVR